MAALPGWDQIYPSGKRSIYSFVHKLFNTHMKRLTSHSLPGLGTHPKGLGKVMLQVRGDEFRPHKKLVPDKQGL